MTHPTTPASHHAAAAAEVAGIGIGWLVLAGLVLVVGYVLACWLWPFAACLRCRGDGKRRSPSGRAWRICPRCGGTGARVRVGRQLVTAFRRTKHRGSRPTRITRTWKDLQK